MPPLPPSRSATSRRSGGQVLAVAGGLLKRGGFEAEQRRRLVQSQDLGDLVRQGDMFHDYALIFEVLPHGILDKLALALARGGAGALQVQSVLQRHRLQVTTTLEESNG